MKHLSSLLILVLLSVQALASEPAAFYSVSDVIKSIQAGDIDNHKALEVTPPEILYHWISVNSAHRLFKNYDPSKPFPMKRMSNGETQPILSARVPVLSDSMALFAWHNPVAGNIGGSGEIYGNNEAVMALKMNSKARIGLIVTHGDNYGYVKRLDDPEILKNYDLILHVTGRMFGQEFGHGYIEWLILNPDIITDFTLDAKIIVKEMNRYKKALKGASLTDAVYALEKLAGPQHSFGSVVPEDISRYEKRILSYQPKLKDLPFHSGWHSRANFCRQKLQ